LSPKTIEIRGADGDAANQVKSAVQSYLNNAPFYLAQHNLIFLSAGRLKTSLLSDPQVYKIGSIAKSFFRRKLTVTLELKSPRYLVNRNNVTYSVYNDGTIQEQLPGDPAQWLSTNPGAVKIKDQAIAPPLQAGAKYLSDDLMARIAELQDRFKPVTNNEIDYFAIPTFVTAAPAPQDLAATSTSAIIPELSLPEQALPLRPADLYVYAKKQTTKKGGVPDFKVIFDLNSDLGSALSKLQLLFSQMPPDRYAKLVYVDVRFDNRAFLCLSGTPCVDSANPAPFSGTIIPAPASPAAPTATSTNLKGQ
jgi:hypothetical protein